MEKFLIFSFSAKSHDVFNAGPVIPTAVEQHHFSGRRQMRDVTLEIPLRFLPPGGRAEGDHAADARVHSLADALDGAALAGGVASLEKHHHLETFVPDPFLQFDQFDL